MLVLTIDHEMEFLQLGDNIRIYFEKGSPRRTRIRIDAPKEINIFRPKIDNRKLQEK